MNAIAGTLISRARAEGFALAETIDLALAEAEFGSHLERYDEWLAAGFSGRMEYLVRGRDRRADPRQVFPEAKSILCVALPYAKRARGELDPLKGPRYARYLTGPDYHEDIAARLERAMRDAAAEHPALRWKICVDTSAVLERSWAVLAGLGWIGKNTMLIHPKLGSYFFLGAVLLNVETGHGPKPLPDLCGHCTRCLDGCPTRAIVEPKRLDSRKCISYWTLENRDPELPPPVERPAFGTWVAGCDVCQEVCPFNRKPAHAAESEPAFEGDAPTLSSWAALLSETEEEYRARVRGSSLSRVKPRQFARNLRLALGNALESASPEQRAALLKELKLSCWP